mmetsp:Transcript_67796/g.133824  ORF Transcript_67796/g.133824 Transcript_67796/m.133824 type:complete len:218 (-) Transcript_67796:246-899(-)
MEPTKSSCRSMMKHAVGAIDVTMCRMSVSPSSNSAANSCSSTSNAIRLEINCAVGASGVGTSGVGTMLAHCSPPSGGGTSLMSSMASSWSLQSNLLFLSSIAASSGKSAAHRERSVANLSLPPKRSAVRTMLPPEGSLPSAFKLSSSRIPSVSSLRSLERSNFTFARAMRMTASSPSQITRSHTLVAAAKGSACVKTVSIHRVAYNSGVMLLFKKCL